LVAREFIRWANGTIVDLMHELVSEEVIEFSSLLEVVLKWRDGGVLNGSKSFRHTTL
jgi:hypothetical protein